MFTDTHCHLDFEVFDQDRCQILKHCQSLGIQSIIIPSVSAGKWEKTLDICRSNHVQLSPSNSLLLIPALGLHPFFLTEHHKADLSLLEDYCKKGELKAIGEIGLDYLSIKQATLKLQLDKVQQKDLHKPLQQFYFEQQLALAQKYNLPVLIHARKSHQDVIQLLKKYTPLKGIIHAFNGSEVQAYQYIGLGFMLGFGGAFTNPRAKHLRYLVANLPLSSMVLETDAPDMLPFFATNYFGDGFNERVKSNRNSPENLIGIFEQFVSLRTEQAKEIEVQLEKNSQQLIARGY